MTERIDFLTPVGRLVQGDCFTPETKDMEGRPLTDKDGQPSVKYWIGLAIPKNDPGWPALLGKLYKAGAEGFPQHFDASGNCSHPKFSFKYMDGDDGTPDDKGRRRCDREGWAGHWILRLSSKFAPDVYTKGGDAKITDPTAVKRGYFVRCYGSTRGNKTATKPGVYVNLGMVELIGYGPEISSRPDGAAVFGGAPVAQMPAGCSATPVASGAPIAQPGPGDFQAMPPLAVNTGSPVAAPPLDATHTAPPPPPFADGPKLYTLEGGKQFTREQLLAAGWKPEQIAGLTS